MSVESLNLIVAALATGGLFFLIGGLTGRLRLPLGAQGVSLELEDPRRARLRLSLAARLARMISDALPIGDFGLGGATLEVRLAQSGDLYESPAEFYQRKFSYFVLFAAISLLIGLLLGLALPLSLAISLLLGGFGLFAPESELADRIGKRRRALRREMAFMLDRVAFAVMAYGTFQKTLAQMLRSEQEKAAPQSTETPGAQTRAGAALGADLVGMGGGLFAEYLNRMAMLLSAGTGGGFEQVRISLDRYYPSFSELTTFLDIVEAGLHGSPMAERLFELGDDMVDELSQEQREAGQRATLVVTAAAGAILVPLLMIVGGPAFNLVLQVFRP